MSAFIAFEYFFEKNYFFGYFFENFFETFGMIKPLWLCELAVNTGYKAKSPLLDLLTEALSDLAALALLEKEPCEGHNQVMEPRRISPHFTIVNWLLPKLLQKVHIREQGEG